MHVKCKDNESMCGIALDRFGDHAAMCNIGAFISARHAALNDILLHAGREAGFVALREQTVPDLGLRTRSRNGQTIVEEARLDVEFFGHVTAPDKLIDGTIWHPAAPHMIKKAARQIGAAAQHAVATKLRRYPPRNGKLVTPCAMETWGYVDVHLDELLSELAVLATQKQRDRGVHPTRWRSRWRTLLSVHAAMHVSKAILAAIPSSQRPCCCIMDRSPARAEVVSR